MNQYYVLSVYGKLHVDFLNYAVLKQSHDLHFSDFRIWGYIASVFGCLLFPHLVSIAEIIMDFNISV